MTEIHQIIQDALAEMEARAGNISDLCEECSNFRMCDPHEKGYIEQKNIRNAACWCL